VIPSDFSVVLISLLPFKSQWPDPITSGHICDSILSFLQNWSKVKKNPVLGVLCVQLSYWLLPYISLFFSESEIPLSSEISSYISEHVKKKSTHVNQRIFPVCKRRCELPRKSFLSLCRLFGPTTQRNRKPYWHSAWQKPNRHFQTEDCVWILVSAYKRIPRNCKSFCSAATVCCFNTALRGGTILTENKQRSRLVP
jgi:hypothetical protein